jgi:osmotically-inducible protein OsmY
MHRIAHAALRRRRPSGSAAAGLSRSLAAGAALLGLACLLEGCTTYQAYRKCGLHGCPADAPLAAGVRSAIAEHPSLGPPNQVYVTSINGVVYLSGEVATELQRSIAECVATQAQGVRRVVDTISITYEGR